jgi:periplasmic protein TonB
MTSVPLAAEPPIPPPVASPNSRFLAGDVPQGASQKARFGNALGFSFGAHVGVVLLGLIIAARLPAVSPPAERDLMPRPDITWLDIPGPGGGGGGGNKRPEPVRKAEAPGKEKITVPAAKPPKIDNPEPPKEVPAPQPTMNIPAVATAAGITEVPGALSGLPASPSTGSGSGSGAGSGTGSGLGPGSGGGTGGGVYRIGSGIVSPRIAFEVKPTYTAEAMRAKIQGTVWLEAVVLPDGSVGRVEITRSLDPTFGLDQEAIKTVKRWRFIPGTRHGQPVPVLVEIEMTFTLR